MKALEQIIRRVAENPSHPWALATLVQTKGSTYRRAGARLLVDSEGSTLGVLSGGCLEEESGRHGRKVIEAFQHPSELAEDFHPDTQTAALVMNHNFGRDLLALDRLLPLQLRYVGLLGAKERHAELLARLSEYRPLDFESDVRTLHAPAGLDIGSEAPEEIALAIVSEVAAVLSDRRGGFLRERGSDIHATIAATGGAAA